MIPSSLVTQFSFRNIALSSKSSSFNPIPYLWFAFPDKSQFQILVPSAIYFKVVLVFSWKMLLINNRGYCAFLQHICCTAGKVRKKGNYLPFCGHGSNWRSQQALLVSKKCACNNSTLASSSGVSFPLFLSGKSYGSYISLTAFSALTSGSTEGLSLIPIPIDRKCPREQQRQVGHYCTSASVNIHLVNAECPHEGTAIAYCTSEM